MDPNSNLKAQREVIARLIADEYEGTGYTVEHDGRHLADLAEALDGWISKGGFLPYAWRK
jgi:hypothetical protein